MHGHGLIAAFASAADMEAALKGHLVTVHAS